MIYGSVFKKSYILALAIIQTLQGFFLGPWVLFPTSAFWFSDNRV